jgi:hypothetical protein
MASGDLDVSEVYSGVEHDGHKRVSEHVGVHALDRDPRRSRKRPESTGRAVPVHATAGAVAQYGSVLATLDGVINRSADRWGQRHECDLVALAVDSKDNAPVHLAELINVGAGGLEDAQPEKPDIATSAKSFTFSDSPGGQHRFELEGVEAERG